MKKPICTSLFFISGILLFIRISSAQTPDWIVTQNHDSSASNIPMRLTTDGAGNVTVLNGFYAANPFVNLLKYNASGSLTNIFYLDSIHVPYDIISDASGNYYVAGAGSIVFNALLTVQKISSSGVVQWTYRDLHDIGLSVDIATRIMRDASGNIYITGYWRDGFNADVITIKLNSNGVEQWRQQFDLSGKDDFGNAISVDGSGNVYVTGSGLSSATGFHKVMLTLKYNSTGALQWSKTYAGVVPGYDQQGNDLVTDASGNSFVTGYSRESDTLQNIVTIKYSTAGNLVWKKKYAGGGLGQGKRIFMDAGGNLYVAGENLELSHADSLDLTTIKYSGGGSQLYINHYDHGKNYNDHCVSAWLDASSNLYIAGYSNDTTAGNYNHHVEIAAKYNSVGSKVWSAVFSATTGHDDYNYSITADAAGNAFTGGTDFNASTGLTNLYVTKRTTGGGLSWSQQYNGPLANLDSHNDLVVDNAGNSYALGQKGQVPNSEIIVDKRDVNGNLLTTFSFKGDGLTVIPQRMILDAQNNVYVCGYGYQAGGTNLDMLLVKFNKNGILQWNKWLDASGGGNDFARSMAVDASSNIYITGFGTKTGQGNNIYTSKYSKTGTKQWTKNYNDINNTEDIGESISIDNSGNVFVTGYQVDPNNFGHSDVITIKYNNSGTQQWASISGAGNNGDDNGTQVLADNSGGCYVTGHLSQSGQNSTFYVQRIASNGSVTWTKFRQVSTVFSGDYGGRLLLNSTGNVYALGYVTKNGLNGITLSIYKYKSNGDTIWTYEKLSGNNYLPVSGNTFFTDQVYPQQMALDSSGNLYLANTMNTTYDVQVVKLKKNGAVAWMYTNDVPDGNVVPLPNLAINPAGIVWCLFNVHTDNYAAEDWRTIKFPTGVQFDLRETGNDDLAGFTNENLLNAIVYPNPAINEFELEVQQASSPLTFQLFDLYGRELQRRKLQQEGMYFVNVTGYLPGVYLYTLSDDVEILWTGKLMVK